MGITRSPLAVSGTMVIRSVSTSSALLLADVAVVRSPEAIQPASSASAGSVLRCRLAGGRWLVTISNNHMLRVLPLFQAAHEGLAFSAVISLRPNRKLLLATAAC